MIKDIEDLDALMTVLRPSGRRSFDPVEHPGDRDVLRDFHPGLAALLDATDYAAIDLNVP